MELETMKEWIRHTDTRAFLEDVSLSPDGWVTIFERRYGIFEHTSLVPILVAPKHLPTCLCDADWNYDYRRFKPPLVLPKRRDFLCKAFLQCHPGCRRRGSEYNVKELEVIARKEYEPGETSGAATTRVRIRRDAIRETTQKINKLLVLAVDVIRCSERTLAELSLEQGAWEFAGDTFRYNMSAAPLEWGYHNEGGREMLSTTTQLWGKKVVRL